MNLKEKGKKNMLTVKIDKAIPTAYSLQPTAYSLQPTAYSLQPDYLRLGLFVKPFFVIPLLINSGLFPVSPRKVVA
ncbi:hypothetical protein [Ligilactobacillus murinus]|uniref:hypothetical protein n=1 Tax=Ligilactobacillus murinus TaxID=1622 RepID=UPI0013D82DB6|nr:hypothetical protein [Ligilactobacillus murinus]NEF90948.1 hypothetical protein [Ligilactobacillus murinus]